MLTRIDRAAPLPQLSWQRTRDGRMEVYDRGERTRFQLIPRHVRSTPGMHYGVSPPVETGDPSYRNQRDALDALAIHLIANPGDAR